MLEGQLRRMQRSRRAGTIVVATTTHRSDLPIVVLARQLGVAVTCGSEHDLLDRHLQAAEEHGADIVVKVPSDCPLIDPAVMDRVIEAFLEHRPDYASNLHPPTWPDGQDVEVMSLEVLRDAHRRATATWEREHTTAYIWDRPDRFEILNVEWDRDLSNSHRLTVDYPEDLALVDAVLSRIDANSSVDDIVRFLDEHPALAASNAAFRGVNWYRHHLSELRTVADSDTRSLTTEVRS